MEESNSQVEAIIFSATFVIAVAVTLWVAKVACNGEILKVVLGRPSGERSVENEKVS